MRFEFATAARIVFGPGTLREAGGWARALGTRALVVTGRKPERAAGLVRGLEEHGIGVVTFPIGGEPSTDDVEAGVRQGRQGGCDLVIGFGGGSALDAAKAIAAMLTNGGELLDYLEVIGKAKALERASAPWIGVPTTAGTGAEVTRNAVLASRAHGVKVSLRGAQLLARGAIVDPELTHGLPPGITANTGMDALTQLIEPFVSGRANPVTDALCREGLRRAGRSLARVVAHGEDTGAREDMAVASLFGGLALANAGLGAVHGFAGPIGGRFAAPHGGICAALLAPVMETNIRALRRRDASGAALERYREAARILTGSEKAGANDGVTWVRELMAGIQILPLGEYGITRVDVPGLCEKAAVASSMKGNPVGLTAEELRETLEAAL